MPQYEFSVLMITPFSFCINFFLEGWRKIIWQQMEAPSISYFQNWPCDWVYQEGPISFHHEKHSLELHHLIRRPCEKTPARLGTDNKFSCGSRWRPSWREKRKGSDYRTQTQHTRHVWPETDLILEDGPRRAERKEGLLQKASLSECCWTDPAF